MSGKPKNLPLDHDGMYRMEKAKRGNRLYNDESRRASISAISGRMTEELSRDVEKIQLINGDLDVIKSIAITYVSACARAGTLPTFIGLSRSLGHSRTHVYRFLEKHAHTPIAEFLEIVRDSIAEALDEAALNDSVNYIHAIFILKSIHDRVDKSELRLQALPPENPIGVIPNFDEIQAKYLPDPD